MVNRRSFLALLVVPVIGAGSPAQLPLPALPLPDLRPASELLLGLWLYEFAELTAMRRFALAQGIVLDLSAPAEARLDRRAGGALC